MSSMTSPTTIRKEYEMHRPPTCPSKLFILICVLLSSLGCESDDPKETAMMGDPPPPAGLEAGGEAGGTTPSDETLCAPDEDAYPSEAWAECISDDGRFELAGTSTPSSAARVAAFEAIADLLWRNPSLDEAAFIDAEFIYSEEGGVGSRVTRRYDAHVPKPEGSDCADAGAAERWPEYCVGPALIEPLILNAFAQGNMGLDLALNAARVRAGLLWFYYVSVYKEAYTCAGKAADCDSHWAYSNGAKQVDEPPLGLGRLIKEASEDAYEQLFDAHLGVRCWRDLDRAEISEDEALQDQALRQLDRALDTGYALMLMEELKAYEGADEEGRAVIELSVQILAPPLLSANLARDPTLDTDELSTLWESLTVEKANALITQLRALFSCP